MNSYKLTNVETQCLASLLFDQKFTDRDAKVGDLSPKGRVAEGNDKMDSTIIKSIQIYRRLMPTRPDLRQQVRNMSY